MLSGSDRSRISVLVTGAEMGEPRRAGSGMPVQQFGQATQFSTAAAMLAHHTGATVLPAFVLRRPDSRYKAVAGEPIPMDEGPLRETLQPNVQRIADLFASLIRQHPEQWFNYVPLFSAS